MPRKPRIHFPGAVYHVILRGNAGNPVFFEDRDRCRLYLFLQQATENFRCRIHGFCLMTNHIHLLIQVSDIPLSQIMQSLSLRYTKWINYTQQRTGHLFQGRYKALLLDADSYLLELVRYIHLNPVRARMTTSAEAHPWSGHRAYSGAESIPWLTTDWVLSLLAHKSTDARRAYCDFIADGVNGERRIEFHNGNNAGGILGDDIFADEVLLSANHRIQPKYTVSDVVLAVSHSYGIEQRELTALGKRRPFTEARALAAVLVTEAEHLCLTELGKCLNREVTPLSRAAQRVSEKAQADPLLAERIDKIRSMLEKSKSRT